MLIENCWIDFWNVQKVFISLHSPFKGNKSGCLLTFLTSSICFWAVLTWLLSCAHLSANVFQAAELPFTVKHIKGPVSQKRNILSFFFTLRSLSRSLAALEVLAQRSFISVSFCTLKINLTPKPWEKGFLLMLDWLKNSLKIIFILFFDLGEEFWSLGLGSQLFTLGNDVLHLLKNDDIHNHLFAVGNESFIF